MDHNNFKEAKYLKSKFFKEFTLGSDKPGKKNWVDNYEKELGCALGYTKHSIEYFINDWRYRGKLVPEMGAPAAFGCSYTFGYGSNLHWPGMLGVANLGQNGASNDQITRLAITYCKQFKPNEIYVLWSFKPRREHVLENGGLAKFRSLSKETIEQELKSPTWISGYTMLSNDAIDHHNYQKNKLLLCSFCDANGIMLHQKEITDLPKEGFSLARDNDHPGEDWHTNMAGIICEA